MQKENSNATLRRFWSYCANLVDEEISTMTFADCLNFSQSDIGNPGLCGQNWPN